MLKRIATPLLLLLALGGGAYVILGGPAHPRHEDGKPAGAAPAPAPDLIVYYMDMGKDCSTCLNLESYTRAVLDTWFADELAAGRIAWRSVDVDLPENEHFIREYGLYTKSVVLVRLVDGAPVRFDSLSRIWELVYDKEAYMNYVRGEVLSFLESAEAPE